MNVAIDLQLQKIMANELLVENAENEPESRYLPVSVRPPMIFHKAIC